MRPVLTRTLLLAPVFLCLGAGMRAQNIEGQIVASQFGEFEVPNNGNGFTFPTDACQVNGGGRNFVAFSPGVPIKIVDPNPSLIEVVTPVAVFVTGGCSVSLATAFPHSSFYLTSGTGGLQEAINNGRVRSGSPNTIILNAEWYALVAPGNPATVLATVTGGAGFGLVDITTAPYSYYSWNGTQFVSAGTGGGGSPTGAAGGALSGTYPNPGLASNTILPAGTTATTQSPGDNSNKVATDAFVQAALPSSSVSSVFGRNGAVSAGSGDYSVAQVTGAAPLASPAFTGSPTAPTQTAGDNSTRIATTAYVAANAGGTPSGAAGGALSGTYPNPGLLSPGVVAAIGGQTITPAVVNNKVQVNGVSGSGIGVAQSAWSSTTGYAQCSAVSLSGSNYLAVAGSTNVTPGTNSAIWYPVPTAGTPTQGDCAFYLAASMVNGSNGAELDLPPGTTNTCIGFMEPTVVSPGYPNVVLRGAGKNATTLLQTCSISNATVQQPDSGVAFALAGLDIEDFAINANFNAPAAVNVYGAQQFKLKHLQLLNPADGSDHYIEFGHPSAGNHTKAWTYEMDLEDIDTDNYHGPGFGAVVSASVTGGVPTFSVSNGGSFYVSAYSQLILSGTGANADSPCTNRGSDTLTVSGGAITAITSTATGCSSPLYASVFGGNQVTYCFKFNDASDSKSLSALTPSECNTGVYNSNITSMMTFFKVHPIATMIGIVDQGNNDFISTQIDSVFRYGFDFEGATNTENVYGSMFEWGNQTLLGSSDYHFGKIAASPTNSPYAINIFGDICGNAAGFNGYNHLLSSAGSVDSGSAPLPAFVHLRETNYCNQTNSNATAANYVGQSFSLSNGDYGNVWQFGLGSGGSVTNTVTNPFASGAYSWVFANPSSSTSGVNFPSPVVEGLGSFWNGSASSSSNVQQQLKFGPGANPAETYAFSMGGALSSGAKGYSFDRAVSAPGFYPQSGAAGPYVSYFDDFLSTANNSVNQIGGTGATCLASNTYADANHPGNIVLGSNTTTGDGVTCGLQNASGAVVGVNTSSGWTWETAVFVPVLPGTTASAYQAGLTGTPQTSPWTNGIGFSLSSANGTANDWYLRYGTVSTDCAIAATASSWTRLSMVNDGTLVHWFVNGAQCGSGVAVGSMPSGTMYAASWSAVTLTSGTAVNMGVDYVDFQRAVVR